MKNIAEIIMIEAPEGSGMFSISGISIPNMVLSSENIILNQKKLLVELEIFLLLAAGIKNKASTRAVPIILILDKVTSVTNKMKR